MSSNLLPIDPKAKTGWVSWPGVPRRPWLVFIDLNTNTKCLVIAHIACHTEAGVAFSAAAAEYCGGAIRTDDYGYYCEVAHPTQLCYAARAIAGGTE